MPLNVANPLRIFPGIILRQRRTDRKLMGLLRGQCVESRKRHLRYCCNQVWSTKRDLRDSWREVEVTSVSNCRPLTRQKDVEHWTQSTKETEGRLRMGWRQRRSARESQEWVIHKRKRMSRRCNEGEGAGGGEEGAGGGEEGAGGGEEGAGGGREKELVQLVHELLQIKEEQEREDDDCQDEGRGYAQKKYGGYEWTDFVQKKTRRWRQEKATRRHKKQGPCRKTRIREKKEAVVASWRHKKKAKFTLKRKEDTRPKVRLSKKRNRRTSLTSDSDL